MRVHDSGNQILSPSLPQSYASSPIFLGLLILEPGRHYHAIRLSRRTTLLGADLQDRNIVSMLFNCSPFLTKESGELDSFLGAISRLAHGSIALFKNDDLKAATKLKGFIKDVLTWSVPE